MTKKYEVSPLYDKTDLKKKFSSRTGPVGEIEQNEWLKECPENTTRHREIEDYRSAAEEAASCMSCDFRASADCSLRMLAGEFELKDPRG